MLKNDIITGISCLHFEWTTLEQAFERVGQFGLDGVEFSTTRLEDGDYARCGELSEQTGLGVGLHAWGNFGQMAFEEAVAEFRLQLGRCVEMRAKHLVVHLGSHPDRQAGLQRLVDCCGAVAPEYEQAGVIMCLENHYPYAYHGLNELGGDPDDFLYIFERVNSPAVRFCLDYGHSHMANNTEEFIERLAPWLAYTHIADNMGEHDDHLAPEDGTVDWPETLRLTMATGFRGPYIIEFPEKGDVGRFERFLKVLEAAGAA